MNKYFCNAPFNQLELTPEGKCRICCKMPGIMITNEEGVEYKVQDCDITTIWKSDWMNNFRQRFIDEEKRPECQMCWDDEAAGITSLRQQLEWLPVDVNQPKITSLVLKLSNKCNCACRICSFWLSSLWQTELEKTNRWDDKNNFFIEGNVADKVNNNWDDWKLHLHNLDRLFLYGGEPLINYEVLKILDYIVDNNLAKNITLFLNTNGTVLNEKIINIFKQFKEVFLYFSIDDVFERYEYERWPLKHDNIFRDLKAFHDIYDVNGSIHATLYTSISIFNVLYLQEILNEFKKFPKFTINFDNLIHEPKFLSIYDLPHSIKEKIKTSVNNVDWNQNWETKNTYRDNIINFLFLYNRGYDCKEYLNSLELKLNFDDVRRKQNWKTTFSKLYNLLLEGIPNE